MLSFNLTIVLQMVGFLVFAYLLNLLFFKPIIAHIAARNRYLVEQQATAIQLLKEAQELQSAHEERLQVAQREAQLSLDAAVREAQEQRTKLLAAANLAAHELL
ncbi:MAG: hypothetical protein HY692_03880, partial [Cyanobacteria bacterium NC_groundwater_1444_Ag_S-0.65um_54_12]|nr:hypothetical protein [Cyanobacteria bacterium NC_groundwater_1444_Ag_S-0.65um_54_12]